ARLAVIVLGVVMIAAFFVLLPRRHTWFTGFWQSTMYVYLLHTFVLYPIRESGILKDQPHLDVLLLVMIAVGTVVAVVLSTSPVRRFFRPLVEPKPTWIFAKDDGLPPGPSRTDPTGSKRPKTESVPTTAPAPPDDTSP